MARIRNARGRREDQSPSGYARLFGNGDLGNLLSRVQGTVISAGSELEHLIVERCHRIEDLDAFITNLANRTPGVFVATKTQVKASKIIDSEFEPDLLAFDVQKRICYVIEVKDGDTFDTKKAAGESATLHRFVNDVSSVLPFTVKVYVCSFNVHSRKEIYDGLKHKFEMDELLTGTELCELLGINYGEIVAARSGDQEDNLDYFLEQLLTIPAVKAKLSHRVETKAK